MDESGLTTKPSVVRSWAPRGKTPVLQCTFNWEKLSVIGAISAWNFYFRIHEGAINTHRAIEFLKHLARQINKPLLIIWDGAMIHRSKAVKEFLSQQKGAIWVERLPAYAPEVNPVEYIWAYLKQHELGNLCIKEGWRLAGYATAAFRRIKRKKTKIIGACWKQAELWI